MYSSFFLTSECFLQMVHVLSVVLFTMDILVWWHKHFKKSINVHIIHMWCLFYLAIESYELLSPSESSKKQGVWFSKFTLEWCEVGVQLKSELKFLCCLHSSTHACLDILNCFYKVCEEMICSNWWFCIVSQFLLYLRWIAYVLCNAHRLYELDQL